MNKYKITITVKCVCCGAKREVAADEVEEGNMPTCSICYSVMIADTALAEKEG